MPFWVTFLIYLGSFVLSELLRPKPNIENARAASLDEFDLPVAKEGHVVPIIFGKVQLSGPNVIWYGDYRAVPIVENVRTGMFSSDDITRGYRYHLAIQMGLCRGPIDGYERVWHGDKLIYDGGETTSDTDVYLPNFFGGDDRGGGIAGKLQLVRGVTDAAVNSFFSGKQDPLPTYQNTAYFLWRARNTARGGYIGNSPQVKPFKFEVYRYGDRLWTDAGVGSGGDERIGDDMNPIAAAYECLTDTDWGLGFSQNDVDLTNFVSVASTIATEGLGFSMVISNGMKAAEFLREVERHIDGTLGVDIFTGKFVFKLARNDYDIDTIPQVDETNINEVVSFSRGEWSETDNEVRLTFVDRDKEYNDSVALAQDIANLQIQGQRSVAQLRYPGVLDRTVANKLIWRDIRGIAYPLAKLTITVNRTVWQLQPGDVFAWSWAAYGITKMPFRVSKVDYGDDTNGMIRIDAAQDIFQLETTSFVDPPSSGWTPPIAGVTAFDSADQWAIDSPRVITRVSSVPNLFPAILTGARLESAGNPLRYEIRFREAATQGGQSGSYTTVGTVETFMYAGELRNAESGLTSSTPAQGAHTIEVDPVTGSGETLDEFIGNYNSDQHGLGAGVAVIEPGTSDEEWVIFDSAIDDVDGIELQGVLRGALDSKIKPHSSGDYIWFPSGGGLGISEIAVTPGYWIEVILIPISETDELLEASATAIEYQATDTESPTFEQRRYLSPLLPIEIDINGSRLPSSVNADTDTGNTIPGLVFSTDTLRDWEEDNPDYQMRGMDGSGPEAPASSYGTELHWWLYDLETDPSPTDRGDAVLSGSVNALLDIVVTRDQIAAATTGNIIPDTMRIEVESRHTYNGDVLHSREVYEFDFSVTSDWQTADALGELAAGTTSSVIDVTSYQSTTLGLELNAPLDPFNDPAPTSGTPSGIFEYRLDGGSWVTLLDALDGDDDETSANIVIGGSNTDLEIRHSHGRGLTLSFEIQDASNNTIAYGGLTPQTTDGSLENPTGLPSELNDTVTLQTGSPPRIPIPWGGWLNQGLDESTYADFKDDATSGVLINNIDSAIISHRIRIDEVVEVTFPGSPTEVTGFATVFYDSGLANVYGAAITYLGSDGLGLGYQLPQVTRPVGQNFRDAIGVGGNEEVAITNIDFQVTTNLARHTTALRSTHVRCILSESEDGVNFTPYEFYYIKPGSDAEFATVKTTSNVTDNGGSTPSGTSSETGQQFIFNPGSAGSRSTRVAVELSASEDLSLIWYRTGGGIDWTPLGTGAGTFAVLDEFVDIDDIVYMTHNLGTGGGTTDVNFHDLGLRTPGASGAGSVTPNGRTNYCRFTLSKS